MKEHNGGSTEHIAIYIVDERVLLFLFFLTFASVFVRLNKTQKVPDTEILMRKHLEPSTPLYLMTMNQPNKKKKNPL